MFYEKFSRKKHLCWSLFLIRLQASFIKKSLQGRCFSVIIAKFLRTPILKNISKRLLLPPFLIIAQQKWNLFHSQVLMNKLC